MTRHLPAPDPNSLPPPRCSKRLAEKEPGEGKEVGGKVAEHPPLNVTTKETTLATCDERTSLYSDSHGSS